MSSLAELRAYHPLEALARPVRGSRLRSIGWSSIIHGAIQIFSVGLAWVVFANVQDREQTITIGLLGLAYAGLQTNAVANRLMLRRIAGKLEGSFASRRQENDPICTAQSVETAATDRMAWLDYTGLALLGTICLYHLSIAILYGAALKQILELN